MKLKLNFVVKILITILPSISFANLDLITWKGTYYQAVPKKKDISLEYCKVHTPGTFIHVVKDALAHPSITDKGIKLDRGTFHVDKVDGVYLIHGDFFATGKTNNIPWQDHIYYFLYKFTEAGVTKGIWNSNECKGLYRGVVIDNKNL